MERHTILSTQKNSDTKLLYLTKQILTKTLFFDSNCFDINTIRNILSASVNLVYLLKDLTSHFFDEFADCFRSEVIN